MSQEKGPVVLIHGCHLQAGIDAENGVTALSWNEIEFGSNNPESVSDAGRVVAGIRTAFFKNAAHIIFSTGASEKNGMKEGKYIYEDALARVEVLARHFGIEAAALKEFLETRSIIDIDTQNTAQELNRNINTAIKAGADEVYLVTSAWHAPRVANEAAKVADTLRAEGVSVPTLFTQTAVGPTRGTAVIEAPHRGDLPRVKQHALHTLIPRFFRIPFDRHEGILNTFERAISETEATLKR